MRRQTPRERDNISIARAEKEEARLKAIEQGKKLLRDWKNIQSWEKQKKGKI